MAEGAGRLGAPADRAARDHQARHHLTGVPPTGRTTKKAPAVLGRGLLDALAVGASPAFAPGRPRCKDSGGPAPYGWRKDDRTKVDPEAARAIREAQQEILAGVRIGTIRARWWEQGLGNPRAGTKRMAHHHVEHILTNPRLVGYRTYHGEILTGDDGEPIKGAWEPINTVAEWEAVCAAIAERKQQQPRESSWPASTCCQASRGADSARPRFGVRSTSAGSRAQWQPGTRISARWSTADAARSGAWVSPSTD
ncbi:recombinase family protein [Streptomyces wuyuanensis]|uniref:recombinase family protein n=1 Tax=Streptomyces wuyuanensis TaxID=1196353 RepID=UPI0037A9366A